MDQMDLERQILELDSLSVADRETNYPSVFDTILLRSPHSSLSQNVQTIVSQAISDGQGVILSRRLLQDIIEKMKQLKDPEARIQVASAASQSLQPRVIAFEEQDSTLKELLADSHEKNGDYIESAKVLNTIALTSSQRNISDEDKAKVWIRITRCYLQEDDPTSALTFLNRVKNQIDISRLDDESRLHFQLAQARISDSQRNFLDASATYQTLSEQNLIDEAERLQALAAAIKCAILAPAGPKRVRQLARLYHDTRAPEVDEYSILQKIFLDRILTPQEVATFSEKLAPHQKAVTADGSTVLDKAVLEHNILAASRLYSNIHTETLSVMLDVEPEVAELNAAQMIEQGRLKASIDQVDGLIRFEGTSDGDVGLDADGSLSKDSKKSAVEELAEHIELVAGMIKAAHPQLLAQQMVH